MKITNILCYILFSLFFFSCETDDIEDIETTSTNQETPWNNRFYGFNNIIDGKTITSTETEWSTNINVDNTFCTDELSSENITEITLKIYIPKHPNSNYLSGISTIDTEGIVVGYEGNQETEDVFESGSVNFIETITNPYDSTQQLSGFEVKAKIPSSYNITKSNIWYVDFPFLLKYLDEEGNEIYSEKRTYALLAKIC